MSRSRMRVRNGEWAVESSNLPDTRCPQYSEGKPINSGGTYVTDNSDTPKIPGRNSNRSKLHRFRSLAKPFRADETRPGGSRGSRRSENLRHPGQAREQRELLGAF